MHGLTFDPASHTYALDSVLVPSVTGIIGAAVINGVPIMDKRFFSAEARDRGTYVHECVETINRHGGIDWDSVDPLFRPYVEAYAAFLAVSGFKPMATETRIASRDYRFAGTIDALGMIGDKATLIDVKSGAAMPYHAYQLGGYSLALAEAGYKIDQAFVVQVKRDGKFSIHGRLEGDKLHDAERDFLCLRRVHAMAGDPEPIQNFDPKGGADDDLEF